ncbi:unnamed protein product [Chondrus crispus]|uniref:Uncharacterized protein n=1 Tax=Chondrus crispus TaxID=2769 RepID=R7QMQ4_CHOCR|nr:unnamed protein product [Chondrus crispus]CDF38766.1 unnamed protein product [Chondrus crispus]|eukprot:XP_005718671.1 unnamed protein product [Chondrus crispus]
MSNCIIDPAFFRHSLYSSWQLHNIFPRRQRLSGSTHMSIQLPPWRPFVFGSKFVPPAEGWHYIGAGTNKYGTISRPPPV